MEFLALIHGSEDAWENLSDDERPGDHAALHDLLEQGRGRRRSRARHDRHGDHGPRSRNGDRLVTDGPYAEVKEALGGYFILECESIDEACRLAAEIPAAEHGAVEVRPVHVGEES